MPDQQALELLMKSVKRYNEWKSVRPGAVDLDGANLSGVKLTNADLSGASLTGADLSGADLSGANLQSAVLYKAVGVGAVMARCRLDEAYAAESNFENADMSQVRAVNANFARASLQSVRFDHAKLVNVKFDEADLSGSRMVGALVVGTRIPEKSAPSIDMKEAVVETGSRVPPLPSVDFKWISQDGLMFTIGRWVPKPDVPDDKVPPFVLNLRKFNRGDVDVIKGFAKLIAKLSRTHHLMSACDTVVSIPASKSENTETPVTQLSHMVAEIAGIRDGTGWLIRHKSVLPAGFLFGNDEGKHLDSVRVAHSDLVGGRTILLLDDFIDTGATMRACRHMLLAVGAKRVLCLALGMRDHEPL